MLVVGMASVGTGATARAASTCQVGYTGPNSHNQCVQTTQQACTVSNKNTVTIDDTNIQLSSSGDANSAGNGNGGNAQSGSATNSNGTAINVTVNNAGMCSVTRTVPATTTKTTPTKSTGKAAAPQKPTAKVLPNTSSGSPLPIVAGSIVALAIAAVLARLGVLAYGRIKS